IPEQLETGISDAGYRNASATESAKALPFCVRTKLPFDFWSNPSAINSCVCCAKCFKSEEETPSRVRSDSAIRSVRFILLVRFSFDAHGDWAERTRSMYVR